MRLTKLIDTPIRKPTNKTGKGVHTDVHALLNAGLLDKTDDGKIVFPFDSVHVDFMLQAA